MNAKKCQTPAGTRISEINESDTSRKRDCMLARELSSDSVLNTADVVLHNVNVLNC